MPREFIQPALRRPALNPALALSPLEDRDVEVLHPWYQMAYAFYWNMQGMSLEQTQAFYREARASGLRAFMGFYEGRPAFVMECYDPLRDPLGECYPVQPGDLGMHFFVGPATVPIRHFTRDVLRSVMAVLFDELGAQRVVVEPDARNSRVHRLNAQVGFVEAGIVELPAKRACLAFCAPEDFTRTLDETCVAVG